MSRLGTILATVAFLGFGAVVAWLIVSGDTTTGALVVAALSVLVSPVTGWLTFQWTRQSEKERWERERGAESERYDREERKRRLLRGEEAAKEILTAVDRAQLVLYEADDEPTPAVYAAIRPLLHQIRQQAAFLTDDEARSRILKIADNLYYTSYARDVAKNLSLGSIGYTCSRAAHALLHAYVHGGPMPATPRMDRLQALHDEGEGWVEERYGADDPLRPIDGSPGEAPDE